MGWGSGFVNGREVGYNIADICNKSGCMQTIDRGLGYLCGSMHGDPEDGCGDYFCGDHSYDHDCTHVEDEDAADS